MKHVDFAIGTEFQTCTGQRWRCTDVGRRSIVAIELRDDLDPAWFVGPLYPVPEVVFDEKDIASAFISLEEGILESLAEWDQDKHPGFAQDVVETMVAACGADSMQRYARPRLLRVDRVDSTGEILHPYAAKHSPAGWDILLFAPFSQQFSSLPETAFVQLRPSTPEDLDRRARRRDRHSIESPDRD